MACFTKNQQHNGTNCQFEKYVTTSNYFVLNSLDEGHLNSVCTHYVCDKSENARVCAKWQWNALDWCYWIALPASPVVQSSNTVSCVSLSFRTHPCVLATYFQRMEASMFNSSPQCCIYASVNWVGIGSGCGLSPVRRHAITRANANLLSIGPSGTNLSEIWIAIQTVSFKKTCLKMSSGKWRPFCSGEDELNANNQSNCDSSLGYV